jgi:hypothetical protein
LSMEDPSTIRRAVADIGRAPYGGDSLAGQTGGVNRRVMEQGMEQVMEQRTPFVPSSQYVLLKESEYRPFSIRISTEWPPFVFSGGPFWFFRTECDPAEGVANGRISNPRHRYRRPVSPIDRVYLHR